MKNATQKKVRNSSVELLRIFAMIDIVLFHYLSRNYNLYVVENARIMEDSSLWEEMVVQYIGYLGVPCFMFISGYYGIKFKWNRFATIVEQCFFYGIMSFAGLWIMTGSHPSCYELFAINNYWFMVAYLMVMVMSPALNMMIEQFSSRQLLLSIIALYAVDFGGVISGHSVGGGFTTLMMIYLLARWMKLYLPEKIKDRSILCFMALLIVQIVMVSACYLLRHIGIKNIVGSYDNILNILLVGFLVIAVERRHFYSNMLNKIAASTLSVYLLSESSFGQVFFNDMFVAGGQEFHVIRYLVCSVVVFFVIIIVDKIRLLLRNIVIKITETVKR